MDPYNVLGVERSASREEIKRAYRKRAKDLHPDLNPDDPEAEKRFNDLSQAYAILGDQEQRERFDRGEIDETGRERGFSSDYTEGYEQAYGFSGFNQGRRSAGSSSSPGAEAFAEDLFSELFGRAGSRRHPLRERGADQRYRLKVSFVDAAKGLRKRITLPEGPPLEVTVPAGIEDGQTLRLRGKGLPGRHGGQPGDALIEVQVEPHRHFRRDGLDIHLDLPISLREAVLGAQITVPTISGSVRLKVPPGANTGRNMRLRGKGIAQKSQTGDQYVHLQVMLPEPPDPALEKAIRQWSESNDYNPRANLDLDATSR